MWWVYLKRKKEVEKECVVDDNIGSGHQLIEVFFFQPFFQILENLWKKNIF
jgi:hypothetical protein